MLYPLGIQNTGEIYLASQTQANSLYYRHFQFPLLIGKMQSPHMQRICLDRQQSVGVWLSHQPLDAIKKLCSKTFSAQAYDHVDQMMAISQAAR